MREIFFKLTVNGGVPRDLVLEALQNPRFIGRAVRSGRCFMCRQPEVDRSGLCLVCRTFLSDEEREAARVYLDATP